MGWLWAGRIKDFTATVEGVEPNETKFRWSTDYGTISPPSGSSSATLQATAQPQAKTIVAVAYKTATDLTEWIRVWPDIAGFRIRVVGTPFPFTVKSGIEYTYKAYDFVDSFRQTWGGAPHYPPLNFDWCFGEKIAISSPEVEHAFFTPFPIAPRSVLVRAYYTPDWNGPLILWDSELRPIAVVNVDAALRWARVAGFTVVAIYIAIKIGIINGFLSGQKSPDIFPR